MSLTSCVKPEPVRYRQAAKTVPHLDRCRRCLLIGAGALLGLCFLPVGLSRGEDSPKPVLAMAQTLDAVELQVDVMARGLEHPWSIAFLPDGRELITERAGRLRILDGGKLSPPVSGVPAVLVKGQGGLLDVVPHPDFIDNQWVYLTLAHGSAWRNATRLIRARLVGEALVDSEVLFTAKPWKATPVHYGARFAFLPDNSLLLAIGDGFDSREDAQRLDSHLGKIVRLHDDGSIPRDNPFVDVDGALPEIWSIGHRNPQGLVVDAMRGIVLSHEHGPAGGDEVNRIEPGVNYGWPVATHGRDYSGAAISPFVSYPGMRAPLIDWTPSIAPAGLAVVSGIFSKALAGDLLVATLKSRELLRVRLDEKGEPAGEAVLLKGQGRLRDVRVAPDGSLRVLTDDPAGKVLRLTPVTD